MTSSLFLKSHACWPLSGPPGFSAGVMGGRLLREGGQRPHCAESVGGAVWGLPRRRNPRARGASQQRGKSCRRGAPALPQQEPDLWPASLLPCRHLPLSASLMGWLQRHTRPPFAHLPHPPTPHPLALKALLHRCPCCHTYLPLGLLGSTGWLCERHTGRPLPCRPCGCVVRHSWKKHVLGCLFAEEGVSPRPFQSRGIPRVALPSGVSRGGGEIPGSAGLQ